MEYFKHLVLKSSFHVHCETPSSVISWNLSFAFVLTSLAQLTVLYKVLQIVFIALPEKWRDTAIFASAPQTAGGWLAVMQGYTYGIYVGQYC